MKKQNVDTLTTEIMNSPLFDLAVAEIVRRGEAVKVKIEGKDKYDIPPAKIILMMLEIVDTTNKQGQKKILNNYCEGKMYGRKI